MREPKDPMGPLTRLAPIAPPEHLDALVHQRMHDVLGEQRRAEASGDTASASAEALAPVERWVFALGLCSYGGQLVLSAARLIWRSFAG